MMALRDDWRFFLDNAGYGTPPGRAACSLKMARAEQEAEEAGLYFQWRHEQHIDPRDWEDCDQPDEVLWCACYDADGTLLASLCGIGDPSRDYRRVVQAELALEALESIAEKVGNGVLSI